MPNEPRKFVVVDPRTFDGTSFDVAGRAARQAEGVADLLESMLDGVSLMARNAEMERNLAAGEDAGAAEWEGGPQAAMIRAIREQVSAASRKLSVLAKAAEFDPKHPPKE